MHSLLHMDTRPAKSGRHVGKAANREEQCKWTTLSASYKMG